LPYLYILIDKTRVTNIRLIIFVFFVSLDKKKMSITHCIFDLDGLLLDTESIYTECMQEICAPYGKNFTTDTKLEMMGKSALEAGQILIRKR